MTKGQIAIASGELQEKLDRINVNFNRAMDTAKQRVLRKYNGVVHKQLVGWHESVKDAVELPAYYDAVSAQQQLSEVVEEVEAEEVV